jgi:hypothetical protein
MATPRKRPEDRLKTGRPTLYRPEYCETVIELGREGKSLAQMASHFDVTRPTILEWADQHPEFSTALERARVHAQNWWENQAQAGMHAKVFNSKVWEVSVRARFRDDYTERKEVSGPNGGPMQVTHALDVSGLDDDQLDALEAALSATLKKG